MPATIHIFPGSLEYPCDVEAPDIIAADLRDLGEQCRAEARALALLVLTGLFGALLFLLGWIAHAVLA